MKFRQFWLENASGAIFHLTDQQASCFLNTPSGLGFSKELEFIEYGSVDKVKKEKISLETVEGELIFMGSTTGDIYEAYKDFIAFARIKPLKLHYLPANTLASYYSNIIIKSLEKTEVDHEDGAMHCPIVFKCNSNWLTSDEHIVTISNEFIGDGKSYPLIRDYSYAGHSYSSINVVNNGSDETGFMLEVIGRCINPRLSVSQAGETYGVCNISGTYDYVKVNSVDSDEEIYLELNGASIANAASHQDLSVADGTTYVTFVKLRPGTNILSFHSGGEFNGDVRIRWHDSYVSV